METCKLTRNECMALVQSRAAAAKGEKTITKGEAELLNKKGAEDAAKDSKACAQAKVTNADATCDDAYNKFLETRGKSSHHATTQKTQEGKVMLDAQESVAKDNLAVCTESTSTPAEYKTCIDGFKVEKDALAKAAFGDADAKKLAAQTKQADRKTW